MDDDQFQGNLSVQGGNPDPNTTTTSFETDSTGSSELPPIDFEATPAPEGEAEPEHEIDPEMSRRMDEVLGSFNDGVAAAGGAPATNYSQAFAVNSQPVAPAPVAPTPVAPVEPVAAPAAPVADPYTAPAAVPEAVAPMAPVAPVEQPAMPESFAAPVAQTPEMAAAPAVDPFAAQPVADPYAAPAAAPVADPYVNPYAAPAVDPVAAAQAPAAMPMTTAPAKKAPNKMLIIAAAAVAVVLIIVVAVILIANSGNKSNNRTDKQTVKEEPEENPPINVKPATIRIGTELHGYVDVYDTWSPITEEGNSVAYKYGDEDGLYSVTLNSAAITDVTAKAFADGHYARSNSDGSTNVEMSTTKMGKGNYTGYLLKYQPAGTESWNYEYIFEANDGRTHFVLVQGPNESDKSFTDIIASFDPKE